MQTERNAKFFLEQPTHAERRSRHERAATFKKYWVARLTWVVPLAQVTQVTQVTQLTQLTQLTQVAWGEELWSLLWSSS